MSEKNKEESLLELRSIYDLLGNRFSVPSYQRGYRWTDTQVRQLLEDIWEFANKPQKKQGEFYCLQPIVVKKREDNKYELIDGQQRLTTIHILLSYLEKEHLNNFPIEKVYGKKKFSIIYETREKSNIFLENITNDNISIDNADFYFMKNAYERTKEWFGEKKFNFNSYSIFLQHLLGEKNKNNQYPIMVIWYEINESESNAIDIFTRLNIGKIPLTNSELIKALLLKSTNFQEDILSLKQIQIATEWDLIEKSLQDDMFWFFIYNPSNPLEYENRIEYILDLISEKKPADERYHTFFYFYNKINTDQNKYIDQIWLDIKKYYLTLEEWYKDFELYHYIGFLISENIKILNIIKEFKNKTKSEFKKWIKLEIKKIINCKKENIEEDNVEYGDKRIKSILLLFNIQTIINSGNTDAKFPFNKFKNFSWDVEHVRSRTDKEITKEKEWIDDIIEYLTGSTEPDVSVIDSLEKDTKDLVIELKEYKKDNKNKDLKLLFEKVKEYFKEKDQTDRINNISNLALLDSETNRSYGNAFFAIKRKKIIENDRKGKFVPIATKNLFLKYYSKKFDNLMYWTEEDAKYYLDAIKTTLEEYLSNGEENDK